MFDVQFDESVFNNTQCIIFFKFLVWVVATLECVCVCMYIYGKQNNKWFAKELCLSGTYMLSFPTTTPATSNLNP